jgi:hypothetical protein
MAWGPGKTNAPILLAHNYVQHGCFNRVFIIAPTYDSNAAFHVLPVEKGDVCKDASDAQRALTDILHKIEHDAQQHKSWERYKSVYEIWRTDPSWLKERDVDVLMSMQYEAPIHLDRPSPLLFIDDMSHSDIYSPSRSNPLINLCLRHRHVSGVGVTLFMLIQTFRTGIPKCLRQNVQLWFIWRTQDNCMRSGELFANISSSVNAMTPSAGKNSQTYSPGRHLMPCIIAL